MMDMCLIFAVFSFDTIHHLDVLGTVPFRKIRRQPDTHDEENNSEKDNVNLRTKKALYFTLRQRKRAKPYDENLQFEQRKLMTCFAKH